MSVTALFRGSAFAPVPMHESQRAHRKVRELCARYNLGDIDDPNALVAHVEALTGVSISIETLPVGYPPQISGLISLRNKAAIIHLPREQGVYPDHVLFHELAHLLMWDLESRAGTGDSAGMLTCSDDYVEHTAETLAQYLSGRLLRLQTPRIEKALG